ncbi:MAG: trypsin-like peptidase domain-containing protein [Spirulinaceae cyanobacterium]
MLPESLKSAIVLVHSSDPDCLDRFGTGFVIGRSRSETLILTCVHVVEGIGESKLQVENYLAQLWRSGQEQGIDLAILKVDGLRDREPLGFSKSARTGQPFWTAGFQADVEQQLSFRSVEGCLGKDRQYVAQESSHERIDAWELTIKDERGLQPGYSGSPVITTDRETVVAIIRCRYGDGQTGVAVSTNALAKIWQPVDRHEIHKILLKLGYAAQNRLFRQAIKQHDVAAFLIHGELGYGQRWLLNRLIQHHMPHCLHGKTIIIGLKRLGRRNSPQAFWRDVAKRVNIRDRSPQIAAIAQAVYQLWQTQDVLMVFHAVDDIPQTTFTQLIEEFWLRLADQTQALVESGHPYKLLVFFLDYTGRVAQWDLPRVEKINVQNYWVETPRLSEITENDLSRWLEYEGADLPDTFNEKLIEDTVEEILENSENGIPECVLEEICEYYCDLDWEEVQEQWLRF